MGAFEPSRHRDGAEVLRIFGLCRVGVVFKAVLSQSGIGVAALQNFSSGRIGFARGAGRRLNPADFPPGPGQGSLSAWPSRSATTARPRPSPLLAAPAPLAEEEPTRKHTPRPGSAAELRLFRPGKSPEPTYRGTGRRCRATRMLPTA